MRLYGLDFTSSPGKSKAITCASAQLRDQSLEIEAIESFTSFVEFETFLMRPGPWRAAIDFPFGQPSRLVYEAVWPATWAGYVEAITAMGKQGFYNYLRNYQATHPRGEQRLFRSVDRLARSCSPMQLDFTPVAKMFFEGASRLLNSGISILPVCRRDDARTAVEAYPKLLAERYAKSQKYKTERKKPYKPELRQVRIRIIEGLEMRAPSDFGFRVYIAPRPRDEARDDQSGDCLDAVLSVVQAAWSKIHHTNGIPPDCDMLEGWIVDPV